MGLFGSIRTKVGAANEALAEAKKSWHDTALTEREAVVGEREKLLAEQRRELEKDLEKFKNGRIRRKILYGMVAVLSAIPAFLLGTASENKPPHLIRAETNTAPTAITTATSTIADTKVAECASKGVAYFKEIGSYPVLHSLPDRGRTAEEVAAERCGRSLYAFGIGN